jgi:hypothetical protein
MPSSYTHKFKVTLNGNYSFLESTVGAVTAFKPGDTGAYNGGGTQLFSTEAAKNTTFTPVNQ